MFTGLVEEVGKIQKICQGTDSAVLTIGAELVLEGTKCGDSIAVNGVCLTVTSLQRGSFTADVMHETLRRSGLREAKAGSSVNLERAMAAGGRFGGHIVAGHIDGTGIVREIKKDDNAIWYKIAAAPEILRYVIEKGSIAIDGISLTVAEVTAESFSVSVIPHTAAKTALGERRTGDTVNLEVDCIGKYVEKLLKSDRPCEEPASGITMDMLIKAGF